MYEDFAQLLKDLESFFNCSLKPDRNLSCIIKLPSELEIHLSMDRLGEFFFITTRLGELPAYGSFRDLIFKTALTANAMIPQSGGIFGYNEKTNRLILFAKLPMKGISASKVTAVLEPYIEKALDWKTSLARSEVPIVDARGFGHGGIFGLMK